MRQTSQQQASPPTSEQLGLTPATPLGLLRGHTSFRRTAADGGTLPSTRDAARGPKPAGRHIGTHGQCFTP